MSRVIIIDERQGAMREDLSNIEVSGSFNGIESKDFIVRVQQDEIVVVEPDSIEHDVVYVRVKSEPEASLEKAREQKDARSPMGDGVRPTHTVEERLNKSISQREDHSETGKSAGDFFKGC